nr:extracellular solute-binding protein [Streptomyces sp. NBC_00886]
MATAPDMVNGLIAAYEAQHPNVTIKRQYTSFSDYKQNIKLNMSSDKAPDIAQFNAGAMQSLIPAGLLVNLDPYAKAYHWSDKFPAGGLEQVTAEKNGKTFGTGSLYAVPAGMSVTGVFYNKALMKNAGVASHPATLDEFAADLAKAKAAGQTPLSVGALDNGALHLWAAILGKEMPAKQYRQWVYGQPGGDITTAGPQAATDRIAQWAKQGYIPNWANGTGQVDATARFAEGQTTYMVSGSWAAVDVAKGLGDKAGFFLLPPTRAEGPAVANGSSVAYAISAKSKHPEVAANFLNFLSSPAAAKIVAKGGFMPVNAQGVSRQSGLLGDLDGAYQQVVKDNGLLQFPDAAAPEMLPALQSGLQSVIIQRKSTKEFLKSLQDAWSSSHGQ